MNLKSRNTPLILLNARITKKTYKKWKKISFFSRSIFSKFDICLAQNDETKNYLKKLGAENIKKLGKVGDLVTVKDGFARNYLFSQKKALRKNIKNLEYFEKLKEEITAKEKISRKNAENTLKKLDNIKNE